jgi:hypothetical protein
MERQREVDAMDTMDTRKRYEAPAIVEEDVLEQSALPCYAEYNVDDEDAPVGAFSPDQQCRVNVTKHGGFAGPNSCRVYDFEKPLALS